jgi:hypothetical protein
MIYRPNSGRPVVHHQDRPRSVATSTSGAVAPSAANGALLSPPPSSSSVSSSSNEVKRASSVRGAPISSPRLQSSTNRAILPSRPAPHRPYSMATPAVSDEIQLIPTRAAPVPPLLPSTDPKRNHQNLESANHLHQSSRKAPARPPLAAPLAALKNGVDGAPKNSPSGPPPAPPDSRHRFYSPQNVALPLVRNGGEALSANGRAVKSQSPRRNGVAKSSMTGNGRIQNAETAPMIRPTLPGGADGSAAIGVRPSPHLPPKPVPTSTENHVSSASSPPPPPPPSSGRLRFFRPGVNESQC